jgi:hypothetical protein
LLVSVLVAALCKSEFWRAQTARPVMRIASSWRQTELTATSSKTTTKNASRNQQATSQKHAKTSQRPNNKANTIRVFLPCQQAGDLSAASQIRQSRKRSQASK